MSEKNKTMNDRDQVMSGRSQNICLIKNGRIIDPATKRNEISDILIENGIIKAIEKNITKIDAQVIDANNKIICPGLVDSCAQANKGNIERETRAAARSGITHIACPPNIQPIVDTPAVAHLIQEQARSANNANLYLIGALTKHLEGEQLSEYFALKQSGCIAVSNKFFPLSSPLVLKRCLEYASNFDLPVFFNCQEQSLSLHGCAHDGATATRTGLIGIPKVAETLALTEHLLLIEHTGVRAHIGQISCAESVTLIKDAQKRGLAVTADVAIHQLLLNDGAITDFNSNYHVIPPLRSEHDRQALIQGINDDTIQAICSDHQPLDEADKTAPFSSSKAGMANLEILLPLGLKLVAEKAISLDTLIKKLTIDPASLLGINAGSIIENNTADLCIFDTTTQWIHSENEAISAGRNSPFINSTLTGKVSQTILGERALYST